MEMRSIDPKELEIKDLHQYMVGAIAPRPIAFASTIDEEGNPNIAPYSFFNAFSSNPPILVFSSNRRVKNNTTKDTLHNVQTAGEVVINVVNYEIVRQMAIAGIEYPANINEFEKSGLTALASETVKPFRIKESPIQFECKVKEIIPLGDHGGAGHLIICEVQRIHIKESVIDGKNRIDPHKLDLVGRLGRAYYVRASGDAIFTLFQEPGIIALGFDQLPESIRNSSHLTGNEIACIAGQTAFPSVEEIERTKTEDPEVAEMIRKNDNHPEMLLRDLHRYAKRAIKEEAYQYAFCLLMIANELKIKPRTN